MDTLDKLENLVGSEYSMPDESLDIVDNYCRNHRVAANNKIVDIVLAELSF